MNLSQILLLTGGIILYRLLFNHKGKQWVLFIISLFGVFWLQPGLIVRNLDYWFCLSTFFIILATWIIITPRQRIFKKENLAPFLVILGIPLIISGTRYLPNKFLITATIPPQPYLVSQILIVLTVSLFIIYFFKNEKLFPYLLLSLILGLFVVFKNPELEALFINSIKNTSGNSLENPIKQNLNLSWLGFSYIAFRLIHTIRDFQNRRYSPTDLKTFFNYVLYLPAITAGPIERIQNFEKEIIKKTEFFDDVLVGGKRLTLGLVKKFVIADFFFLFSMNKDNIFLVNSKEWLWVLLFSYAWMIYFDFSGYTDVALGLSALLGINLPENFNRPYFSENLTSFWNRWHISLTQWIRAYFYFPLTRFLKSRSPFKSEFLINSFTQICTMVLIGLWHGITLNFFLWGLWHGFGLVINSLWKNWVKKLSFSNINTSYLKNLLSTFSTAFTFLYVCIGWIWFAIPDFQSALKLLAKFIGK